MSSEQSDSTPTAKVTAGVLTAALTTILIGVADRHGVSLTAEEGAALATILGGLAAWWKKSRPGELDR